LVDGGIRKATGEPEANLVHLEVVDIQGRVFFDRGVLWIYDVRRTDIPLDILAKVN